MSPIEIIFVILGALFLILSCFITGRKEQQDNEFLTPEKKEELLKEQEKNIEKKIEQIIESRTEEIIVKTDDYLSKISNEKIMAVNDFTEQVMQRVDKNNEEIVFLYKRLMDKEDEIKATLQSMEDAKKDMKESVEDVIRLTRQINSSIKKAEKNNQVQEKQNQISEKKKQPNSQDIKKPDKKEETKQVHSHQLEQLELEDMMSAENKNHDILQLYHQGKNVLEISKTLGLGQGEVKLVIDLYGSNKK